MTNIKDSDVRPRQEEGCRGEVEAEGSTKLFWAGGDVQSKVDSSGFSLQGEGKVFTRRDVVRSMFPSKGREPSVSCTSGGRREGAKSGPSSGSEARRSGAALGGDNVVGPKWFPPVGSGPRESASARGGRGRCEYCLW